MGLFDVIPEDFFSVLASPNRRLYLDALDVLWSLYQERMKIPHKLYLGNLLERLEPQVVMDQFDDEEMSQEERANIRGKASFLVRKLKSKGWFEGEHGSDYELFYTLPEYSSKFLDLFHDLQKTDVVHGFSYVYGTYSVLKTANLDAESEQASFGREDSSGRMHALDMAYQNTIDLIKLLKKVYHNIKRYVKFQFDLKDGNEVLAMYYDDFMKNVSETYIRPLKIRESVPKYREFIKNTLLDWVEDEKKFISLVNAFMFENQSKDFQVCASEVKTKVYWIIQQYDNIEKELLDEIDVQLIRYTRIATQKLKNLLNHEENTQGELIYLLKALAKDGVSNGGDGKADSGFGEDASEDSSVLGQIQGAFQLNSQKFYETTSLYERKNPVLRKMDQPFVVEDFELTQNVKNEMDELLFRPYGKWAVHDFMQELFGASDKIYSKDFPFCEEKGYIMSFLSVLYQEDPQCFYKVDILDGFYDNGAYSVPQMVFFRKESL
ncbi:MAG: DUF5716 family protein [bacterium]